jgi:acetyl-CoA carboxylase carboxyltransferase component
MHAEISGTVDFMEKNDSDCLQRLRKLVELLPPDEHPLNAPGEYSARQPNDEVYQLVGGDCKKPYDMHALLDCLIDSDSFQEYKARYGKTIITGYAKMGGMPLGIVANQRMPAKTGHGEVEMGGVLYAESADKAARFIMDCNQIKVPLLFLQDVVGFMVGKSAEQSGIIRSGAKMVNAVSNSIVPKITLIVGNSFGAGNYVMCGKAYDPNYIMAWPNAKYAVMGADQAADTLFAVQQKKSSKLAGGEDPEKMHAAIKAKYHAQMDIRYGAARGWVDAIIAPHHTRKQLIQCLTLLKRAPLSNKSFHTGVLQV